MLSWQTVIQFLQNTRNEFLFRHHICPQTHQIMRQSLAKVLGIRVASLLDEGGKHPFAHWRQRTEKGDTDVFWRKGNLCVFESFSPRNHIRVLVF